MFEYNQPAPSKEEADDIAYNGYLKGDICFPTGLSKDEYLKMLNTALESQTLPNRSVLHEPKG